MKAPGNASQWHDESMVLDERQRDEATDLLRRVLSAVDRGQLTADGPAAAVTVRRLEGALLALHALSDHTREAT